MGWSVFVNRLARVGNIYELKMVAGADLRLPMGMYDAPAAPLHSWRAEPSRFNVTLQRISLLRIHHHLSGHPFLVAVAGVLSNP